MTVVTETVEALEEERVDIETNMARVRGQVDEARRRAAADGVFADPEWLGRAEMALRLFGRDHQIILRKLADIRRQERQTKATRFEQAFVTAARRRLAPEVFQALLDDARDAE